MACLGFYLFCRLINGGRSQFGWRLTLFFLGRRSFFIFMPLFSFYLFEVDQPGRSVLLLEQRPKQAKLYGQSMRKLACDVKLIPIRKKCQEILLLKLYGNLAG